VVVGEGAPVEIGRWLGAREHNQGPGKLSRVLGRAMAAWWRLPTMTRGSPEKGIGRRRRLELGGLTAGEIGVQKERVPVADVAEQKGEGDKASTCMNYCGSEVAAGGCSGRPWRAHGRTARRGTEPGSGRGLRVDGEEAGGGRRRPAQRRPGELHRRQSKGGRGAEDRGGSEEEEEREQVRRTSLEFSESSRASR
jgi:hypothetical protein